MNEEGRSNREFDHYFVDLHCLLLIDSNSLNCGVRKEVHFVHWWNIEDVIIADKMCGHAPW